MKIVMTGSSGGIGAEIKSTLAENNIEIIELTSKEYDLSSEVKLPEIICDGLIHCAGINILSKIEDFNDETFMKVFKINTLSFLNICKQLKFNNKSSIIAIGSLYSFLVKPERLNYSVSKHALLAAVKTLALEMSGQNIKVNMVSPGFVDTKLTRLNNSYERIEELDKLIPLGLTNANEIAKICLYLIKDNQAITGQNIVVDGGYSCLLP